MSKFKDLKIFTLTEGARQKFIDFGVVRSKLDIKKFQNQNHPQEDYLLISKKYPIFCVADGVTLEPDKKGRYPHPSPAAKVAKIFCEKVIKEAEKLYPEFDDQCLKAVFVKANKAVKKYNQLLGRTKTTSNLWDYDLFATTGAFMVIKNNLIFWASICDSYFAYFDAFLEPLFRCLRCWVNLEKSLPKGWDFLPETKKKKLIRQKYRNGIDEKGNLIGYGVATGEETALKYLEYGMEPIRPKSFALLFTDGFENYFELPEFKELIKKWPTNLKSQMKKLTAKKSREDPEKFGQERTLIAVALRQ